MKQAISILTVGSELLDGRLQDTNAHYLTREFSQLGLKIQLILTCGDNEMEIGGALSYALQHSHQVIISGGLGPTADDLTREAVATFTKQRLLLDQQSLDLLKKRYIERKRIFDEANTKQALFPEGAEIIKNNTGTAPGFIARYGDKSIISLPGVPRELKAMFQESVLPYLKKTIGEIQSPQIKVLRIFGLPESFIGRTIDECLPPKEIEISYRAMFPEVQVILKGKEDPLSLNSFFTKIKNALKEEYIFSETLERNFEETVHALLIEHRLTVSTAESCTGGLVGKILSNTSGASAYFKGGVITYANDAKVRILQIHEETLKSEGAVSAAVAKQMAEGVQKIFNTDLAISITGIAGPEGGSKEKPVGSFFIGFSTKKETQAFSYFYAANRSGVRTYAAYTAIEAIRRHLLQLPPFVPPHSLV